MEHELFDFSTSETGPDCTYYFNVKLKVPVGPYPAGTMFDGASIITEVEDSRSNFLGGFLQFWHNHVIIAKFQLHLEVGVPNFCKSLDNKQFIC